MKKTEFNQSVSFKVYPKEHLRTDHTNTIFLLVIIERKKREFNLKVSWPTAFFDLHFGYGHFELFAGKGVVLFHAYITQYGSFSF
ncbi:MAG TPA: hypothetical protein DCO83_16070 [Mucilaginibacter sp.]|jgi:hypothetical protein|nr:hypothetical protein [Mucilaginibacter sp.]